MKKILLVKLGALGDLSYALPAAKALKNTISDCHLTWLVGKTYHSFLKGHSYIDELIVIDDKKLYAKNIFVRLLELCKLIYQLGGRFDCVLILHRDKVYHRIFQFFTKNPIFQLVREKTNTPSQIPVAPLTTHESLAIKKCVEAAIQSMAPASPPISWQWDYSHIQPAAIPLPSSFCLLHIGGGVNAKTEFQLKRWPHWEELILDLLAKTPLNLVFIGAPSEEEDYKKIEKKIRQFHEDKMARCFNLIGKMNVPELTDVIRRSDFLIGVDSGPLHIADSMDKITLGLFGPTSPISWGLLSNNGQVFHEAVSCSPCYKDDGYFPECPHEHRCMRSLSPKRVLSAILDKSRKHIPDDSLTEYSSSK